VSRKNDFTSRQRSRSTANAVCCFPFNTLNSGIIFLAVFSRQALTVTREGGIISIWSCVLYTSEDSATREDIAAFYDLHLNNKSQNFNWITFIRLVLRIQILYTYSTVSTRIQERQGTRKMKMGDSEGIVID
jgi:hypothetical protein